MAKKYACRLCSGAIDNKFQVVDDITREILDVLLLKMELDESEPNKICKDCAEVTEKCFFFKSVCMETEEIILSHVADKMDGNFSLDDIYEGTKEVTGDLCVCRLCLNLEENCIFVPLDIFMKDVENIKELLAICLPEIDLGIVANPVICKSCRKNLCCYLTFVEKSRRTSLLFRPMEKRDVLTSSEQQHHILTSKIVSETKLTNRKKNSEMKLYECATCSLKTRYKRNLIAHNKLHRDFPEKEVHKCEMCTFRTRYKVSLIRHGLTHENFSGEEMYKCGMCSYRTIRKGNLVRHGIMHKGVSEVKMYKCASCSFETKYKKSLINHKIIHMEFSEVDMYKCEMCPYRTICKANLVRHGIKHKSVSEVEMYNCASCSFKTKYEESLVRHQKIHRDFSEEEMYKCEMCTFRTKHKRSIVRHVLTHNSLSAVKCAKIVQLG